jgi:hypothetical protein
MPGCCPGRAAPSPSREAGHAILPAAREVLGHIDEMSQLAQLGQL